MLLKICTLIMLTEHFQHQVGTPLREILEMTMKRLEFTILFQTVPFVVGKQLDIMAGLDIFRLKLVTGVLTMTPFNKTDIPLTSQHIMPILVRSAPAVVWVFLGLLFQTILVGVINHQVQHNHHRFQAQQSLTLKLKLI